MFLHFILQTILYFRQIYTGEKVINVGNHSDTTKHLISISDALYDGIQLF